MTSGPTIASAELRVISLPFREPFVTAAATHTERHLLLVALEADGITGWGECGPVPGYSPEPIVLAHRYLETTLPTLIGFPVDDPAFGSGHLPAGLPATARFAIESAWLDLSSRCDELPARDLLGGTDDAVPVGVVLGIGDPATTLEAATAAAAEGYRRVKVKVGRRDDLAMLPGLKQALPDVDLAIDANGAFTAADLGLMMILDDLGLSFVEQPFPADDLATSARLAAAIRTPVCLDESLADTAAVGRAIAAAAVSILNLKPARLGGFGAALDVLGLARAAGAGAWIGGMLESTVGRSAALALASMPGTTHPADLAPPERLLAGDVATPLWSFRDGEIDPADTPGLGFTIDPRALDAATSTRVRFSSERSAP